MPMPPNPSSSPEAPRLHIVACVRTVQSQDRIGEWLAYHRAIGMTHVNLLIDDTTTDNTHNAVAPFVAQAL
jgi:hypothetical protein